MINMKIYKVIYYPNSSCGIYFSLSYTKRDLLCSGNSSVEFGMSNELYRRLLLNNHIESHSIIRLNCDIGIFSYDMSPRFYLDYKSLMIYYRSNDYSHIYPNNSHVIRNDLEV